MMRAMILNPCVRSTALVLGLLLSACRSEPQPPPEEETPAGPRLDIQAARAVWPEGAPGDFDGDGNVDLLGPARDGLLLARGRGDGTFAEQEHLPMDSFSAPSAVGDLDKDGDLDLISLDGNAGRMRSLMNDGTGRFEARAELPLSTGRLSVTLADVDGDGYLDALATQEGASLLTVWRTAGTGALGTRVDLPTRPGPYTVAAANLDGDGHLELLVANASGGPLEIIDVEGFSGAPIRRTEVSVGHCEPVSLALGDFDGDTDTDVALSCDGLIVLLNDGQAHLTLAQVLPSGGPTYGLTAADVDADGRLDLVLGDHAQGPTLFTGAGDGTFLYRASWVTNVRTEPYRVGEPLYLSGLHLVDVNEDGRLDLLSGTSSSGNYALLLGDGHGGFIGPEAKLLEPRVRVHAFGDLDGDGATDIVAKNHLFLNGPNGTFQSVPTEYDGTDVSTYVFDVNGDGRGDVVAVSGGIVSLWLNTGQTVEYHSTLRNLSAASNPTRRLDVDHDGTLDLVFVGSFARGLANGRFEENVLPIPTRFDLVVSGGAFADHNADGELDVYTPSYSTRVCLPSGRCEFYPQGPGLFLWDKGTKRYELFNVPPPMAAQRVLDLDGDGRPDLVNDEQLARGRGDGTFEWPELLPAMSTLEKIQRGVKFYPLAADVDGDGLTDVVESRGYWVDVMRGQEDGELAPPVTVFAPGFHQGLFNDLRLFDVDDDGLPELVRPTVQGIAVLRFTKP